MNTATDVRSQNDDVFAMRKNAVLMMYLIQAGWGAAFVLLDDLFVVNMMVLLSMATCATSWFVLDRKIFGGGREAPLELLVFFTWPVTLLIYLYNTRSDEGIMLWIKHSAGMLGSCFGTAILCWILVGLLSPQGAMVTG